MLNPVMVVIAAALQPIDIVTQPLEKGMHLRIFKIHFRQNVGNFFSEHLQLENHIIEPLGIVLEVIHYIVPTRTVLRFKELPKRHMMAKDTA
ncbi:hypothetical protein GCM10011496_33000 [Polaromonas eurypsychrophila]|uniref:Uncharacterized protein n=1 Tax=Polaromonas eurypsychrophila TaxID=1614635 RepID=A0A916WLN0_9BURK|nr:hypothetical protein GCM10011496_33000 [Polaromonas eurypsychrophila]